MQHCIAFLESFLQRNGRISLELAKLHAGRTQAEKRYINRSIQGFVYRPLTDGIILFPWLIDGRGLVWPDSIVHRRDIDTAYVSPSPIRPFQ